MCLINCAVKGKRNKERLGGGGCHRVSKVYRDTCACINSCGPCDCPGLVRLQSDNLSDSSANGNRNGQFKMRSSRRARNKRTLALKDNGLTCCWRSLFPVPPFPFILPPTYRMCCAYFYNLSIMHGLRGQLAGKTLCLSTYACMCSRPGWQVAQGEGNGVGRGGPCLAAPAVPLTNKSQSKSKFLASH